MIGSKPLGMPARRKDADQLPFVRATRDPATGCLLWDGATNVRNGYGRVRINNVEYYTHRLAYQRVVGPIPKGHEVRHLCDRLYAVGDITYRRCCEPAHLESGTHAENMRDKVAAGRAPTGERAYQAKLTDLQVEIIRRRYHAGGVLLRELAAEYCVSAAYLRAICSGRARRDRIVGRPREIIS